MGPSLLEQVDAILAPRPPEDSLLDQVDAILAPPTVNDPLTVAPQPAADEADFQQWYGGWAKKLGHLNPDPDHPAHKYDYRAAYRAGAEPTEESGWHWPSEFKHSDHPNRFVGGVDTITGEQEQPPEIPKFAQKTKYADFARAEVNRRIEENEAAPPPPVDWGMVDMESPEAQAREKYERSRLQLQQAKRKPARFVRKEQKRDFPLETAIEDVEAERLTDWLTRKGRTKLPFSNFGAKAIEVGLVFGALERIDRAEEKGGTAEYKDYMIVAEHVVDFRRYNEKGFIGKGLDIAAELPAMGIEFAVTGGAATAIGKGVTEGAKAGVARLLPLALKRMADRAATRVAGGKLVGKAAKWTATKATQGAVHAALLPQMVAHQTMANRLNTRLEASAAEHEGNLLYRDEDGALHMAFGEEGDSLLASFGKGYARSSIELMSERVGGDVMKAIGGKAIKGWVAAKFFERFPKAKLPDLAKAVMEKGGFHGMFEEEVEERFADLVESGVGLQSWEDAVPTLEQVASELVAFSALPAASLAINVAGGPQAGLDTPPPMQPQLPPEGAPEAPIEAEAIEPLVPSAVPTDPAAWARENPEKAQSLLDAGEVPSRTKFADVVGVSPRAKLNAQGRKAFRAEVAQAVEPPVALVEATPEPAEGPAAPETAPSTPEAAAEPVRAPEAVSLPVRRQQAIDAARAEIAAIEEWQADLPNRDQARRIDQAIESAAEKFGVDPQLVRSESLWEVRPARKRNGKKAETDLNGLKRTSAELRGVPAKKRNGKKVQPHETPEVQEAVARLSKQHGRVFTPREPRGSVELDAVEFGETLGKKVVFGASPQGKGRVTGAHVDDNLIFITGGRSEDAIWRTIGHELAHDKKIAARIAAIAPKLVDQYAQEYLKQTTSEYAAVLDADPNKLRGEGIAKLAGEFMENPEFRDKLRQENPTLWETIKEAILKVVGKWTPKDAAGKAFLESLRGKKVRKRNGKKVVEKAKAKAEPKTPLATEAAWTAIGEAMVQAGEKGLTEAAADAVLRKVAEEQGVDFQELRDSVIEPEGKEDGMLFEIQLEAQKPDKPVYMLANFKLKPEARAFIDQIHAQRETKPPKHPEVAAEEQMLPSDAELTGIKKAVVNDLREMVGLPEMEGSTPQSVEDWAETARIAIAADPKAAIRLVNELATNPRPISQHDAMLLQFRYRQLANELEPAVDEYVEAVKSKDPIAIATARTAVLNARSAMTAFEEIIHPSKETWGRTGVALQQMLRKDFSIEAVLRRGQEANHGEELSPEQTVSLTKMAQDLAELQKQFDEQRKKTEELKRELASKKQHAEVIKETRKPRTKKKSKRRQAVEERLSNAWASFGKAIRGRVGSGVPVDLLPHAVEIAKAYMDLGVVRFSEFMIYVRQHAGKNADEKLFQKAWEQVVAEEEIVVPELDATDLTSLSKEARGIQRLLVEAGITSRDEVIDAVHELMAEEIPDFTRRQTMDALSQYGQFQLQSQEEIDKLIRDMNAEVLKMSQIDQMEIAIRRMEKLREEGKTDEEIGNALEREKLLVKATGLVRDQPTETVRQLTKKYNELKKRIPATTEGKVGLLQTAVAAIEKSLTNRIQDLNWEIEHGELITKGKRERPTNERIAELEAERDRLRTIHRQMFPPRKKQMTPEQRIAQAIKAADKAIEEIEKQLETLNFDRPPRLPAPSSLELDARRARLKQLRAARDAAKELESSQWEGEGGATLADLKEARDRKVYEASLRKRIADYRQILARGDFAPKPKKTPRTLSPSELKLKREMEDIRHRVLREYAKYHLKHLHGLVWVGDKVAEFAHLSRALMTSFDLSALLRQGGLPAMGHPILATRALVETIASMAYTFDSSKAMALRKGVTRENAKQFLTTIDSRQAEFDFMHTLTQGKEGEFRLRAGLSLPSTDQAITQQEEAFQGRWGKQWPGIAISGRLYTMILNKMRVGLFDSMVQKLGRGGKVTMEEAKIIASFVNVATGRSDLGQFNKWAAALNMVFFAPRYVASRFQYLAMPFYLPTQGGLKANKRAKQAIAKEYGRTAAGIGTVLGTIALAAQLLWDDDDEDRPTIETDPRSSDFLKVRIGETRLDLMAGLSQTMVLSARMATGQTKSSTSGRVRKFGEGYKPETRLTVLGRFGRSKLAPVPGAVATVANDWTDVVGQKVTPAELGRSIVTPLSVHDVEDTMKAQGISKGSAMSLLAILGVGMNTYGPKTEYTTGTPEERLEQFEQDLKNRKWDTPPLAYSEFLTPEQQNQWLEWTEKRIKSRATTIAAKFIFSIKRAREGKPKEQQQQEWRDRKTKAIEDLRLMSVDQDRARRALVRTLSSRSLSENQAARGRFYRAWNRVEESDKMSQKN